jgi:hypothetical protein
MLELLPRQHLHCTNWLHRRSNLLCCWVHHPYLSHSFLELSKSDAEGTAKPSNYQPEDTEAEQERNDEYDEHATEFQPDDAAASNDATAGVGTHSGMSNGPIGKPIA